MVSLLDLYEERHVLVTNSPKRYGTHLGIQLLGHALGRFSYNSIQPRAVRHNTYVCLFGESTRSKKTTAQEDVMNPLIPKLHLGPNHFSPEGLLGYMGQNGWLICQMGEFSSYLRSIKDGGYMASFKELSNELWSCPLDYTKVLSDKAKSYYVSHPYLSLSTTCTEEEFFANLKPETVLGGFLPRWLLIYENIPERRRRGLLPDDMEQINSSFAKVINSIYKASAIAGEKGFKFVCTENALDKYDEICITLEEAPEYENVRHFVGRYENYILSYADILYVSDIIGSKLSELIKLNKLNELIELITKYKDIDLVKMVYNLINSINSVDTAYIEKAYNLIKPSLNYASKVCQFINEDWYIAQVKARALNKFVDECDWSTCLRWSGMQSKKFGDIIVTLKQREEIDVIPREHGEGQSKKITTYIKKTDKYV